MKHKIILLFTLLFLCLGNMATHAQQGVVATGGQSAGDDGSVSYSIGQIFYQSYEGGEGSVAEGVQQPYETYLITSIDELTGIDLKLSVFPNPVQDKLRLQITETGDYPLSNHQYHLLNMSGKAIKTGSIDEESTLIDMGSYPPGIYFLRVSAGNDSIGHFKIIKR